MSNSATSATAPTIRSAALSGCIITGSIARGRREQRADRVALLARALQVPKAVLEGCPALAPEPAPAPPLRAFVDPDPFREFTFSNRITAKLAIAEALGVPLARLPEEERAPLSMRSWQRRSNAER